MMQEKIFQFIKNRRTAQTLALLLSNAYVFSLLRFIPCGYLQCSNCSLSTFACPLILIERGAIMASMGMLGSINSKLASTALASFAVLILFGALFGTMGCGWLCPFGFLQDLLTRIPVKKFKLPGWAGHLRLPIFIGMVILLPYYSRHMAFCDICPPGTINRLWQQAAGIPLFFKTPEGAWAIASSSILAIVLTAAVCIERPFCTMLCPIGGFLGLFNRISGVFVNIDQDGCVDCGRCKDACPQGINPVKTPDHSQCTRCLECARVKCKFIGTDIRI